MLLAEELESNFPRTHQLRFLSLPPSSPKLSSPNPHTLSILPTPQGEVVCNRKGFHSDAHPPHPPLSTMAESVVNGHNEVVSATVDESIIDIPADAAPAAVEETEEASASLTPAQRLQLAADAEEAAAPKNKNHGKAPQKNREATHIDVASDSAFPSLGGGPSKASIAPVKWGAGAGPVLVSASSAPAESNWSPAVKSAGGQQTVFTLLKGDRRAPADMRRSQQDLVRDIARKTGTKIEVATNISRGSSTYVISGSSADDRDRAKRELRRELTATVGFKSD